MASPHEIRLLGPWTVRGPGVAFALRTPGIPEIGGGVEFGRRFQWVAEPSAGETLALTALPMPAAARWLLNGVALGDVPAGKPARFPLAAPLPRGNELILAFAAWPAGEVFSGASLVVEQAS